MTDSFKLADLIEGWFEGALEAAYRPLARGDFARHIADEDVSPDKLREESRLLFERDAENSLEGLIEDYKQHNFRRAQPIIREISAKFHQPVSEGGLDFARACKLIMERLADIEQAKIDWANGKIEPKPSMAVAKPLSRIVHLLPDGDSDGLTISEAISKFIERRTREEKPPTSRQLKQYRSQLSVLEDFFGGGSLVGDVEKSHARLLYEALSVMPSRNSKHSELIGLPLLEAAKKAKEYCLTPMNGKTLNNYLTTIRSVFKQEVDFGSLKTNPFASMTARTKKGLAGESAFRPEEMARIFGSPVFLGCLRPERPFDFGKIQLNDWRFWVPLISLLTGARVGELAQLRLKDLCVQEGILIFNFNDDGDKRLKASASRRVVPVHDELVRLGLQRLHTKRLAAGETTLLGVTIPKNGNAGAQPGNWFRESFLKSLVGFKRRGSGLHSFRHAFITTAREARLEGEIRDRITGHRTPGVSPGYGTYPIKVLREALTSMVFPPELAEIPTRP